MDSSIAGERTLYYRIPGAVYVDWRTLREGYKNPLCELCVSVVKGFCS